jgi:hypothetical protein
MKPWRPRISLLSALVMITMLCCWFADHRSHRAERHRLTDEVRSLKRKVMALERIAVLQQAIDDHDALQVIYSDLRSQFNHRLGTGTEGAASVVE